MGGGGVGKTAFVIQFIQNHFVDEYDPTIEDSYRAQRCVDDGVCLFDVLDTAGQEEYSAMREQYMRDGAGFLIVYSVTSRASFREVREFHSQVRRVKQSDWEPICLVGNKADLERERRVSTTEGLELALSLGVDHFMECSAKTTLNVEKAFYDVVRLLRTQGPRPRRGSIDNGYDSKTSLFGKQLVISPDEAASALGREKLARCLTHASRINNIREVTQLLHAGADVNAQPTLYGSALHVAAAFGYLDLTKLLLQRGAGINATAAYRSGLSALHEAATNGHLDVVKLLHRKGANINQSSAIRGTPLQAAAAGGEIKTVEYLLRQGADPTLKAGPYSYPLHAGVQRGSLEIVTALLNGGADVAAVDKEGCTVLHRAAFAGEVHVMRLLLERGAKRLLFALYKGNTPLDVADENGHFEAVKLLLEYGAKKAPTTGDEEGEGNGDQGQDGSRGARATKAGPSVTWWNAHASGVYRVREVDHVDVAGAVAGQVATPATLELPVHTASVIKERPIVNAIGFTQVSNPPDAKVDIVFVHGLQGHPEKTWTNFYDPGAPQSSAWRRLFRRRLKSSPPAAGTVFWPYDLLSRHKDFTAARILTWGYDTRVVREIFGGSDAQNISQHGNNLMVMLQQQRKDAPTRPLIFVAHSLGGIVVKTALHFSKQSTHQPGHRTVYSSTIGIVFLGTPHGGSGVANWGLVAANLSKLALQGASTRVLKGLKPNSELLEMLRKSFLQMLEDGHFSIHTFFETLPMMGVYGLDGLVVPYDSALVGHARKEIALGLHGNHSSICKFGSTSDPGYQAVFGALQDYVRAAISSTGGEVTGSEEGHASNRTTYRKDKKKMPYYWDMDPAFELPPVWGRF